MGVEVIRLSGSSRGIRELGSEQDMAKVCKFFKSREYHS